MRLLAITVGSPEAGSTRFRLMQYRSLWERQGVEVDMVPQSQLTAETIEKARQSDIVINQKCLLNGSWTRQLVAASRFLVFDFDDAIYTRPGRPHGWLTRWRVTARWRRWLQAAHLVTTANEYLAQAARKETARVEVVPMAIDIDKWRPLLQSEKTFCRIGWVGAPNNLVHLERLDPLFHQLFQRYPQVRLAVFCGKKPALSCPFDYTPFAVDGEVDFIQQLDIGLLPLPDEEYTCGKSPIKAIQYLACGVPVVGNIRGASKEICRADNSIAVASAEGWLEAIGRLVEDRTAATSLGSAGRSHVVAHHNFHQVGEKLYRLMLQGCRTASTI